MQQQQFLEPLEPENEIDSPIAVMPHGNETLLQSDTTRHDPVETEGALEEVHDWLEAIELRPPKYFDPLILWIVATPLWSVYTLLSSRAWSSFPLLNWIFFDILVSTLIPATITTRVSRIRREAREDHLADQADVRWIGPLVQALDAPHSRCRAAVNRILPRLLSRLKTSEAGLLDALQQTDLIYTLRLNRPRDMDLNVAIIKALERVGDEAALSAIEYVAETNVWLPSQRYVQRTARVSLVRMESRLAEKPHQNPVLGNTKQMTTLVASVVQRESVPEVAELKQRLKEEQDGRIAPGMRRPFLFAAWTTLLPGSLWLTVNSLIHHDWLVSAAFGVLFAAATQLPRYVLSQEQAIAAQRLAAFDNVQGVGPLAEALEWPDPAIRATAARSLTRLLPLLNAADGGLLTSRQRGCLHRVLRMGNAQKQEALLIAILKALEQVGDEEAVPYVKQLANGQAKTRIQQHVQDRARECLPFLEAGASQRQGSQILLRASSIDATQPDVLLRPAAGSSVTEPVQLLRAGKEGE